MTAALRGFNMELNETSAQRVNDVYSNLAANAAANTHEIADAMTRTASIANAAGMEFETTAAFLTQMIETTRESAENLGTAMKTIVARFTEMKKAPGEIIEVDGEEVNVNKVEAALKSVGVQLRNTKGEFRDLDDVFLELASKWDSLDVMSQRYVATMAAGSRQQSRFIAMMSNYQRTMELTGYATNSAGASQKQFEKTMDSLESKLNRLHDAWEQYVTGIANQSIIKGVVDLLTSLLETVNKVTDALDPLHTGWSKILAAFLGFKAAKGVVNGVLKGIGTQLGTRKPNQANVPGGELTKTGLDEKQGTVDGTKYGKGFWGAFQKMQAQKKDPMGTRPVTNNIKQSKQLTKEAAELKKNSAALKNQGTELTKLEKQYKDYSNTIATANTQGKNSQKIASKSKTAILQQNQALQRQEASLRKNLAVEGEAYRQSVARTAKLQEQEAALTGKSAALTKDTAKQFANTSSEELNTAATVANQGATEMETAAKEKEALATEMNTAITTKDTIEQEANNMTRMQAIAGLFSLNSTKRLAAAVSLGLMSAEEAEAIATKGATAAHTAFNAALYACPIMWIIAAIAALIAVIALLAYWVHKAAEEQEKEYKTAMEGVAEATEDATQKAQEAQDAYKELLENKDTYNQLREELRSLVEGSDEYISKLQETRQLINELISKNPELAKYVSIDEKGLPTLSEEGWQEQKKKALEESIVASLQVSANGLSNIIDNVAISLDNLSFNVKGKIVKSDEYTDADLQGLKANPDEAGDSNKKVDVVDGFSHEYLTRLLGYAYGSKIVEEKKPGQEDYIPITGTDSNNKPKTYYIDPAAYKELQVAYVDEDKNLSINTKGSGGSIIGTLTDESLFNLTSQIFSQYTKNGTSLIEETSKSIEGNFKLALGTVLSQPQENEKNRNTAWASAFSSFYAKHLRETNNVGNLVSDIENKTNEYLDKDKYSLDKLIKKYKEIDKNFDEKSLDDLSSGEEGDDSDAKKRGYLAKKIANAEVYNPLITQAIGVYDDLMKNHHDKFVQILTVGAKKVDDEIDEDLLKALTTYEDAGTYFNSLADSGKEFLEILKQLNLNTAEFEQYWDDARAEIENGLDKTFHLFYDDEMINKLSSQDPSKTSEQWKSEFQKRIINQLGAKNAFSLGELANNWEQQAKEFGSSFDANLIFSSFLDSPLFADADSARATYERIAKINFTNPVQAAKEISELANDSNQYYAELGETLKRDSVDITSVAKQAKYIYDSIDDDTMSDLFEDSVLTREEINELTSSLPGLKTMLDANSISASTLATYFTKVHSGMLDINTTSTGFLLALDKINKATTLIADSLEYMSSFSASESQQTITDSFIDWRESMKTSLERGQYGDQNLIDYSKAILGLDNWNKYYNEFNGNLQKVEELAFQKISLWKDNFYDLWGSFAGQSDIVSVGSGGEINFDLSKIDSIEDLKKALMDTFDISEEVAEAAIVDAQTYSSTLTEQLNNLSLSDSIKTLLESSFVDGTSITVSKNEIATLAEAADMTTQELVNLINKNLKKGYKLDFGDIVDAATGQLTDEFREKYTKKFKEEMVTEVGRQDYSNPQSKQTYKTYERNLNSLYTQFISKGLEPAQAKKEVENVMKNIFDDDDIYFYVQDGVVTAIQKGANESKEQLAKKLGIPQTQLYNKVEEAVSDGALDGLTNDAVDAQKKLDAINTTKDTAAAIAVGIKVGTKMGSGEALEEWATSLYSSTRKALDAAFSSDVEKWEGIISAAAESSAKNLYEGNDNSNNGGTGTSYADEDAQEGWNKDDDSNSDSDNDDWTNDYDKYYNTLKKVEGLDRKRTELEKQLSRLTKQRYLDEEKIQANKKAQVDLLKQQARINSDLADTAAAYLRGDSNGDVWFDEATGTIQTNPNAAYYNEKQMKAFNDQKSLMEDHYETWKEAKDNLEDIYDAIDELTEVAEFSLEDLTDSVDRAIEVLDNTLTNLDREISRLDRYDSGATSSDYKKRYEQSAQTYADKYNQLTTKKAINEQKLNGQTYSEYGKYINVDWDTKEVTKSALYYAIVDPDVKDSVDDFVSEAQEIASNIIDMDNQQEEIRDSLYELQQTLADKSLEFQEKVYDAVIKSREDEITTLNTINNSIKDAASELISSIQKNIQKIRQDRNNKKTEEELSKMQSRLDFLRMDTSSGNQKTILDLEKQLEDKEQSYTDSLIDQKISELQDQNTEAEKQRKRQIEIMETQLELSKENGAIWKAVDSAIKTGFNSSGRIQKGSDLYNMLSSLDEVTKKNSVQFERWFGELNNLAAAYNANLTADLDTSGQMSNTVSNANDVYGENSEYIKSLKSRLEAMNRDGNFNHLMWYDQEGQKMVYKYSHYYANSQTEADAYNKKVAEYQALARELANARAFYKTNKNASFVSAFNRLYGYDTGGLADYTGLAWLDGTPTSPEMVLSSKDTENFIQLKDILSNVMNGETGKNNNTNGDYYFEIAINVDKVTSDYDVDQIADRIKQQISDSARYRNVNVINLLR